MLARWRAWLAMAVLASISCSTCGPGGRAVPFKRGLVDNGAPDKGMDAGAARQASATDPTREGHSYPPGTTRIELENRVLGLPAGAAVRAALELGRGLDPPAELLLVTEDSHGALVLEHALAQGSSWSAPERVAGLLDENRGPACGLKRAGARVLDAAYALISVDLDCVAVGTSVPGTAPKAPVAAPGSGPGQATAAAIAHNPAVQPSSAVAAVLQTGAAFTPFPGAHVEQHLFVIGLEGQARVLEHVAAISGEGPGAPQIVPTLQSRDLDADGSTDLVLALDVTLESSAPTHIELKLFSRAGGLARDTSEPETTLRALADQAKDKRRSDPSAALELSLRTLAVHDSVCRESGSSRLYVGGSRGLDCGASLAAGRAASVLTALLASQGKLLEALARFSTLGQSAYQLAENDWERARVALRSRVDDHSYGFRAGPQVALPTGPRVRRSAVAFVDEGHLLLRDASARSYDLHSGALEPTGIPAETLITGAGGRLAISQVVRSCEGYRLSIVQAAQVVAGVVTGPSIAEPLFARAEPPPGAHCPELSREQRADDGGFRVLEWTPAGVLIARAESLWLLALDGLGAAIGEARALGPSDALPPLVRSGELTADGRFHALLTPLGIAIQDRKAGATRLFAAPEGEGTITELALSPSARTLAVLRGGKLLIGTLREPPMTTPGTTPAAATPPRAPSAAPTRDLPPAPPGTPATPAPPGTLATPGPPATAAPHRP